MDKLHIYTFLNYSDIQFYFTGENKIEGRVTTVDDPINGGIPGTVFYLIGQKVE